MTLFCRGKFTKNTHDFCDKEDGDSMMVEISVIMPAYNCEEFVRTAVESVLHQTFVNFELIIVDDCSNDSTYEILLALAKQDARIRLFKNELNQGVAKTRNFGISQAMSKAIALLDSDDTWDPFKLEKQYELFRSGNRIVYCSYDFIDVSGNTIKRPFIVPKTTNFKQMLTSNVISCSTILAETELLKTNPFSDKYYHEDYVLWMQLIRKVKSAAGCQEILAHYRLHEDSRSSKKSNAAIQRWKVYREELKLNYLYSVYAFVGYAVKGIVKYYLH